MAEISDKEKREKRFKDIKRNHNGFREKEEKSARVKKFRETLLNDKRLNKYKKFFDMEEGIESDEDMFFQ